MSFILKYDEYKREYGLLKLKKRKKEEEQYNVAVKRIKESNIRELKKMNRISETLCGTNEKKLFDYYFNVNHSSDDEDDDEEDDQEMENNNSSYISDEDRYSQIFENFNSFRHP